MRFEKYKELFQQTSGACEVSHLCKFSLIGLPVHLDEVRVKYLGGQNALTVALNHNQDAEKLSGV